MRISDWSSDVCSSDLSSVKYARMPSVDNGSLSTLDEPCLRCSSTATIIRGRSNLNRRSAVVATAAHHPPRRKQRAITIRSDHALQPLALLPRHGRSPADLLAKALDRMQLPQATTGTTS